MKRPDGWDELYLEAYRKEHSGGTLHGSPERAMFEAGADAFEKAIWKMAKESPTGTFTFDTHTINVFEGIE